MKIKKPAPPPIDDDGETQWRQDPLIPFLVDFSKEKGIIRNLKEFLKAFFII